MHTTRVLRAAAVTGIVLTGLLSGMAGLASAEVKLSQGATVYVPVYSHINVGIKGRQFDLAISLSIRNTDPASQISVTSTIYHDSKGKPLKEYVPDPLELGPLASKDFFISELDMSGGLGASFIVKWKSETPVNEPIIEGVMSGTRSGQGISFTTRGRVIEDRRK